MSDYFAMSEQELNALATAINTKTGHSGQILGANMASEVSSIASLASIAIGGAITIDFDVPNYAFYNNTRITSVTFGEHCTSIGDYAFYGCTNLETIDFGNVKTILSNAFATDTKISSLNLKNVETVGSNAFGGCTGIQSLNLGSKLQTIGSSAFSGCTGIQGEVIFPETLYQIDFSGFQNCSGITSLVILKTDSIVTLKGSSSGIYVFRGTKFATTGNDVHIYVPNNLLSSYQSGHQWSGMSSYLTPYVSSATIGTGTYSYDYGNTFAQWVASAYNTDGFVVSGNNILNSAKTHYVAENGIAVTPTKLFIGTTYTLEAI
jgi:hypothetical protein